MPEIAIIDPLGKHAGFHYYVDGQARGLAEAGQPPLVFVTAFTGAAADAGYDCRVAFGELYGSDPVWKRAARYFSGLWSAVRQCRRAGVRTVFLHSFHCDIREVAAICAVRLFGMKPVVTMHDIESFGHSRASWQRKAMLANVSGLIFQNAFSASEFARVHGKPGVPTAIIPHGNYIDDFPDMPSRAEARARVGLPNDQMVFLFFGNPRTEKGLDLLIDAAGHLRDRPGWRLAIAGKMKPEQLAVCNQQLAAAGIAERVHLDARHISDEQAMAYYRAADLVVLPYRRIYESGVAIMAMGFARAILTSDLPPFIEMRCGVDVGDTFHADNVESLHQALLDAMDNSRSLDPKGERGQALMVEVRSWSTIGRKLAEFVVRLGD